MNIIILNKLLTVQLLIQKKTNGIVFDNDAKGCYDCIVSGIALAALRRIVYSKNSVRMLGLLWAQLEHHVATGFGVSDASYKSTMDKLLYGIVQGSCSSPIVWALINQLLLMALGEEFDCISLVSVDGITTDTRPGKTDDNHNLEPIPSSVRGLTQEEDSLVARMEEIIQFFLDLLQVTGRPNFPHWDIEEASIFIRGSKVTSDMKNQLTSQMHDGNLRSFLMQKESWYPQIFDSIGWNASEQAMRRLSKSRQMNVVKLCHIYWHTGSRHVKFYGGERPCCFCQENKEDWRHILNSPSLDASYHRDASWKKVKKDMQMWRLLADFWIAMEKGLHHLHRDLK
jgi:hypothetical protein